MCSLLVQTRDSFSGTCFRRLLLYVGLALAGSLKQLLAVNRIRCANTLLGQSRPDLTEYPEA